MEQQPVFLIWSEEEFSDQHLFSTDNFDRACAVYQNMKDRYGNAMQNDGLAEAMKFAQNLWRHAR